MDTDFGLLHFSTVIPGPAFQRLARRIESAGVQVIYDLEDTHWDPDDDGRTRARRAAARQNLRALAASRTAAQPTPLTVRINAVTAPDHVHDVNLLAELSRLGYPLCVVLPKVEEPRALTQFLEALRVQSAECIEILPLVETRRAIDGLDGLMRGLRHSPAAAVVRRIMYGMFDHCLDCGRWPFWDPRSREFWDLVTEIVTRVESHGFEYVHTPIAAVADDDLFRAQIARLRTICTQRFGVTTLVEAQLRAARREAQAASDAPALIDAAPSQREKHGLAAEIVQAYAQQRARGRELGFAIAGRLGHFISPHEVVAARAYLEAHVYGDA